MTDRRNAWTEAMDAELAQMWAEGHTGKVIAAHFGTSRNSIIGRAHRLHLTPRPSPIPGHVPALPKPVAPKVAPRPVMVAPVPPPAPPRMPSVRSCQYPYGDPRTKAFRFCGASVWRGVYCREHYAAAYILHRSAA